MEKEAILTEWLQTNCYYSKFREHGFDSWLSFKTITKEDLEEMEVKKGHVKLLLLVKEKGVNVLKEETTPIKSAPIKNQFNIHGNSVGTMNVKPGVVNNNTPVNVDPKAKSGTRFDEEEIPPEAKLEAITGTFQQEAFVPVQFLHLALERAEAVCRIVTVNKERQTIKALGTGFLVKSNLVMTNNHVLTSEEDARNVHFQFFFDDDQSYLTCESGAEVFITDPNLDFTVVSVEPILQQSESLLDRWKKISPIKVPEDQTKIKKGSRCNIIGHPKGNKKLLSIQKNVILKVNSPPTIRYTTDTDEGSSGSPVFDNEWKLIGLHHKEGDSQFIDKVGNRFIDNEGISIDRIAAFLKNKW